MDESNNDPLGLLDANENTAKTKYEVPTLDRTLSQEFYPPEKCPVSPIGMTGRSSRFAGADPAETSRFGGMVRESNYTRNSTTRETIKEEIEDRKV